MPDTSKFIDSYEFNGLIQTDFDTRMLKALKNLATKEQVKTALNVGDKNTMK